MKKVFIICPVRNATPEIQERLRRYVQDLETQGYSVHYPPRDTDQNDPRGEVICRTNFQAIREADEVHVFYNESSAGMFFDLGGTFMLIELLGYEKKVVFINEGELPYNAGKSFQKLLAYLAEKRGAK